ncbi:unnamed protein product [Schistocephalus solidus]|uniref:Uncharacterized protein n=1 Tax=Schistocephalus solidus TaxID=70667 RepID=A0A183SRS1_SCHSO|nr:unnamed protein product [Schistocephalus solidus]
MGHVGRTWVANTFNESEPNCRVIMMPVFSMNGEITAINDSDADGQASITSITTPSGDRKGCYLRPPMTATVRSSSTIPPSQHLPTYLALTVTAHGPHVSTWSGTCKSIAQRPANQCQEHQHTPVAPD